MFEAQGMKEQMVSITNLMLQNMVNEAPQFKNCRFELMQFFMQTIGYDVIKKDLARIYLKHFTVSEIREITKFYKSPVGQKMRKVSTSVLIEVNNLSIQRVQSALPKFLEEMKNKGKL